MKYNFVVLLTFFNSRFFSLVKTVSVWELLNHGLNLWLTTWGKHWVSCRSTCEGNSAVWLKGVELGCTSPGPHLRADYYWGRISSWRSLLMEFLWAYNTGEHLSVISDYFFQCGSLTSLISLYTIWHLYTYLLYRHQTKALTQNYSRRSSMLCPGSFCSSMKMGRRTAAFWRRWPNFLWSVFKSM